MEAAGLTDMLKQEGDFTLFAPTDEAFAGLSERDLSLLKSEFFHTCHFQGTPHLELLFSFVLFRINEIKDERRRIQDMTASLLCDQVTLTPSEPFCSITSVTASSSVEAWRLESLTSSKLSRAAI